MIHKNWIPGTPVAFRRDEKTFFRPELPLPNIHYTCQYARIPVHRRWRTLLRKTNVTIRAPIDTVPGPAFLGSLGLGWIAVGYVDIDRNPADSVLTDSYSIESLMETVQKASSRYADWCREASRRTMERYTQFHAPSAFGANFKQMLVGSVWDPRGARG